MAKTRIEYHRDNELFRAALGFTAAQTGFSERLIEHKSRPIFGPQFGKPTFKNSIWIARFNKSQVLLRC